MVMRSPAAVHAVMAARHCAVVGCERKNWDRLGEQKCH
jgi:hypothetical protein